MYVAADRRSITHTDGREDGHPHPSPYGQGNTFAQPEFYAEPNTDLDAHGNAYAHSVADSNRDFCPPHSYARATDRDTLTGFAGLRACSAC